MSSWSPGDGVGNLRGGDLGESTVKVGPNCGEWKFIETGLGCLPGDPVSPGRSVSPLGLSYWRSSWKSGVEARVERGGKSREARERLSLVSGVLRMESCGLEDIAEGDLRWARFSKWERSEDTGLWMSLRVSN